MLVKLHRRHVATCAVGNQRENTSLDQLVKSGVADVRDSASGLDIDKGCEIVCSHEVRIRNIVFHFRISMHVRRALLEGERMYADP